MFRTGFGYDVHKLEKGYDLWIGGIKIPFEAATKLQKNHTVISVYNAGKLVWLG